MGRIQNYLRYRHDSTFGVVAASQVGSCVKFLHMRNTKDRFIAVPANEDVLFWDLKTKQIINRLENDAENAAEVSAIDCHHGGHPRTNLIAIGYANGQVRLYEYETGQLKTIFTGHRTAISALAFDQQGSRLATGGKDCNIVIWDIFSEKGLFSLKGHKNSVTKLKFLQKEDCQKDVIISSSLDPVSTIKFWDIQTQHCFYTLPGQVSGVWSFVILRGGTRLVTGSSSSELKVYGLQFLTEEERVDAKATSLNEDDEDLGSSVLEYGFRITHLGNILRNTASTSNRVQDIVIDDEESIMACHSIDKNVEIYGIRNPSEALTYAKKSIKKAARKQAKRKRELNEQENDDSLVFQDDAIQSVTSLSDLEPQTLVDCEFNRKLGSHRLNDKVKAIAITRTSSKDGSRRYAMSVMCSANKIDNYVLSPSSEVKEEIIKETSSIENVSHRSDVRAIAISSDNSLIISASAECVKMWRLETLSCISTIETDYATCIVIANVEHLTKKDQKDRFALLGTKKGQIQIIDIASASVIEVVQCCDGEKPLTSIYPLPDKTGIVCGGEDGVVRFYNYIWRTGDEETGMGDFLSLEDDKELKFQEGITCINVSSNGNLLAVALLDSTVRVHFVDTFKYFLTMYGHKFPVTTMDISDDNALIATGSPDKNIKIWGLDFGDCHKSIFAHDDAITAVKFVPKTHYIFSAGRDRAIKQWDADHFTRIQALKKHQAEIWCMAVSPNGKYIVSGSHDKSIRLYRKTEEILVPSEEEEAERELEDEKNVFEKQENVIVGEVSLDTGFAPKMTIETIKSTDRLIEAIDVFDSEREKERVYRQQCQLAEKSGEPQPTEPERDPLLMTAMTSDYRRFMLEMLRRMRTSEIEEILITLPFDYVRRLLMILVMFLEMGWDVELMVRCATFLLKVNFGQISASPVLVPVVHELKSIIMDRSSQLRDFAGFNLIALEHISNFKKYRN